MEPFHRPLQGPRSVCMGGKTPPGPLAYGAGLHSFHKGIFVYGWMDAKLLVVVWEWRDMNEGHLIQHDTVV